MPVNRMHSTNLIFMKLFLGMVAFPMSGTMWAQQTVHFATGLKIGEVTDNSAVIWTRLTRRPQRNPATGPMFRVVEPPRDAGKKRSGSDPTTKENKRYVIQYPNNTSLADVRFAVPGAPGEVRLRFREAGSTAWQPGNYSAVDANSDFTWRHTLRGLQQATRYEIQLQGRSAAGGQVTATIDGQFATAPSASQAADVQFVVSTGQAFDDRDGEHGFDIYPQMLKLQPEFFVHTGDIVYYDKLAKNAQLARYHWQRTYSLPTNVEFHRQLASYFIKDDHDTLVNDCWPGQRVTRMGELTFEQGQKIFREQVPMGESIYRTFRWGRDLQVWLVEGRDFRSPNPMPDGPQKSIWGTQQKSWFKQTVAESDATFKILISPTPLVGPDRNNKADNHANRAFAHEGRELREFIGQQANMFVVCGDRHWQYHSVDPLTGVDEYSCGPASDKHAGGWRQNDFRADYHRFLNVAGGFLRVAVSRAAAGSTIEFRHYDTSGRVRYEKQYAAE